MKGQLNRVENIVAKDEIAISPFVIMFSKKSSAAEVSKNVCMWERVKTCKPIYSEDPYYQRYTYC